MILSWLLHQLAFKQKYSLHYGHCLRVFFNRIGICLPSGEAPIRKVPESTRKSGLCMKITLKYESAIKLIKD